MKRLRRMGLLLGGLTFLLSACSLSLAQDVTPPPGSELSAIEATLEPIPESEPDLQGGEQIYTQSCLPCHGVSGLGNGPQAGQLPVAVPPIGDPEFAAEHSPEEWFETISRGNLDNFMPPFAGSLSALDRWDVLGYVYSLGAAQPGLIEGPVDSGAADAASGNSTTAMLAGVVKNGSGGALPVGAEITLYVTNHLEEIIMQSATLETEGVFAFEEVELNDSYLYLVSTTYEGLTYFSEPLTAQAISSGDQFALIIYESTSDPSAIQVSAVSLVFDFLAEGQIRVVEQVLLSNLGDRAVVPPEEGLPVLRYALPSEASDLIFEQGQVGDRYEVVDDGFYDYRAVLPGKNTYHVLFAFELPYNKYLDFVRPIEFPTEDVLVFVPENSVQFESDQFFLAGQQRIEGVNYFVYQLLEEAEAGREIHIELRGVHPLGNSLARLIANEQFLIGLTALTVTVGAIWIGLRRRPSAANVAENPEALMDAIVDLDGANQRGEIAQEDYLQQRAQLKKQLGRAIDHG
ncbi:MAG: cytochrome c [Chloroflexi bacterium]|nr:cytochrome c [Chloroflexota bacterium]